MSPVSLQPPCTPHHLPQSMYAVSPLERAGLVSPGFLICHINLLMLFLVTVTVLCENSTGFGGGCSLNSSFFNCTCHPRKLRPCQVGAGLS